MNNSPIGIFDSGIGGLTVAHAIKEKLPNENIIYFGDTKHLPYGEKSSKAIQSFSKKIVNFLISKNCKVIVIACNSASSVAFDVVEKEAKNISVFNVIDPVVKEVARVYANYDIVYGVNTLSLKSFLQAIYYFVAIVVEVPLLLIKTIPYIFKYKLIFIAFTLLIVFFFLITNKLSDENKNQNKSIKNISDKFFLLILILSLLLSTIIFFISKYPSSTFGYYNRMMIPSFVSLTIIVSIFLNKINKKKYLVIPVFISFFWIFSMFIQLDNLIKSWELKNEIIEDISIKIQKIKINDNFILVANVPYFLKDNYNNEIVFFSRENFKAHLNFVSSLNLSIWPVSHRILSDPMFYPNLNIINKLYFISDENYIYYYEFEEDNDVSIFEYLGDKHDMLKKFESIKLEKINNHPIILREKIRLRLIKFIQDNFNIR